MHLLVIGYSGLDQEVAFFDPSPPNAGVKTLTIVDHGEAATNAVMECFAPDFSVRDTNFSQRASAIGSKMED